MLKDISNFKFIAQSPLGGTSAAPIAYGTLNIGVFTITPNITGSNAQSIAMKSNTTAFSAYGTGYLSRIGSQIPVQLATLIGATIETFFQNLVNISTPTINGCLDNESEEWKIYLKNAAGDTYFVNLFFFKNSAVLSPIFGKLYGIK